MSFFKFGKKGRSKDGSSERVEQPSAGRSQASQQQQKQKVDQDRLKKSDNSTNDQSKPSSNRQNGISPAQAAKMGMPMMAEDGKKARNMSISRSGRHKERRQRMSVLQQDVYSDSRDGANCRDMGTKGGRPGLSVAGPPTVV